MTRLHSPPRQLNPWDAHEPTWPDADMQAVMSGAHPRPVSPPELEQAEVVELGAVQDAELLVGNDEDWGPPKAGWLFKLAAYVLGFTIATVVAVQVGIWLGTVTP